MKKTAYLASILCITLLVVSCSGDNAGRESAQAPPPAAGGLSSIVPAGAQLEKMDIDYEFDTAGLPCWFNGELYFTNNIFDPKENSKTMKLDASRGTIFDRNERELAVSIEVESVYAVPNSIEEPENAARELANCLGGDVSDLTKRLTGEKRFLWVK